MKKHKVHFPGWHYGPRGERQFFEKESDLPAGEVWVVRNPEIHGRPPEWDAEVKPAKKEDFSDGEIDL